MGASVPTTVFLDWGGTVAQIPEEFAQPWKVWRRVLERDGPACSDERVRLAIETADEQVGDQLYAYLGRSEEFWRMYEGRVMDALGIPEPRRELEESIRRAWEDESQVRLYPESPAVLRSLRERGYRTGLISNHHDRLLRLLRDCRLEPLFDSVTFSQEVGAGKPDPRIFTRALGRAGCRPSEAVHVGDSIGADVEGARRSGIAPIWLNRRGIDRSPGCPVIHSLNELVPLLDRWP